MSAGARPGFRPDIQGMRALAVLAVLGYHAGIPGFGGGYLGVDVFFVISGYLIGGHLVRSLVETGRIDLWSFYARRARRILPASLTVIALTVLAALVLAAPVRRTGIAIDGIWAALSGANLRFAVVGTDYLAGTSPSPLQHYWSLGVEEQFYVMVPLLLIALFALLRRRPRVLAVAGLAVIIASFAVCLLGGSDSPWVYFGLPSRAWELGAGVLAAVIATRVADVRAPVARTLASAGAGLLIVALVAGAVPGFPHPGAGTIIPVVATALLLIAGATRHGVQTIAVRGLSVRPAVAIGTLSFSLYLVHWPLLALAHERAVGDGSLPMVATLLLVAAAFPAAWLLWRFVERPFLAGRFGTAGPRRSVLAGLATVAALSTSLLVAVPALAAAPLSSGRTAVDALTQLPTGAEYVPANIHPTLSGAVGDTGELYTDGCQQSTTAPDLVACDFGARTGPMVVLFGDSHAGRWFPAVKAALADQQVRLVTLTKSGCRSLETEKLWAGAENRSCASWRAAAIEWIAEHRPDVVLLADHLGRSDDPAEAVERRWRVATVTTVARFPTETRVAILAETPEYDFSPPACLSLHLGDALACSEPRADAVNTAVIAGVRQGADEAGASFLDLTDWFCGPSTCATVIGRTLVYTDEHHMSATFAVQLGPALRAALQPLLTG